MFTDFTATDRWTKKQVHCLYQALMVAIATRHADAVDIKFLVDGRPVWVALPHPAWVEYKKRTGKVITDSLAKEIAGHFLKTALESGEGLGREMYALTIEETLKHLEGVVAEVEPPWQHALVRKNCEFTAETPRSPRIKFKTRATSFVFLHCLKVFSAHSASRR
jgi:hypothetical protein